MYDFGARMYDMKAPHFLQMDPLADMYSDISPYVYCLNNPIIHTDSDGRSVDNEYNIDVKTGKTTQISNKGGDKTDTIHIQVGGKTIYSTEETVQKVTENVRTNGEIGFSFTDRRPGEIHTTNYTPTSGALSDPSAEIFMSYAGGKFAELAFGAIWSKAASFLSKDVDVIAKAKSVYPNVNTTTLEPGPFATKSIPARSASQTFTTAERNAINEIGTADGCHTCGSTTSGRASGNFTPDHQPVSSLVPEGTAQKLYPHCSSCSSSQGGTASALTKKGYRP